MLSNLFSTMSIKNSKIRSCRITPNFILMTMHVFHILSVLTILVLRVRVFFHCGTILNVPASILCHCRITTYYFIWFHLWLLLSILLRRLSWWSAKAVATSKTILWLLALLSTTAKRVKCVLLWLGGRLRLLLWDATETGILSCLIIFLCTVKEVLH